MDVVERIIKEAGDLFIKHGIRSITMDDIARDLGVSKRTIYEHFRDKDELLKQCILRHKEEQSLMKKAISVESSNVLEAIYRVMYWFMLSMKNTHPSFISDVRKYHYRICEDLIKKYQQENINETRDLIHKGIKDGLFMKEIHVDIVARILNVQLKALFDETQFPPEQFSVPDVFKNIILSFF